MLGFPGVLSKSSARTLAKRNIIHLKIAMTDEVPSGLPFVPFHFIDFCAGVLTNPVLDASCRDIEARVCVIRNGGS